MKGKINLVNLWIMDKMKFIVLQALTLLLFFTGLKAQERGLYHIDTGEDLTAYQDEIYANIKTLFNSNEVIEFTILSDFRQLAKDKDKPEYQKATYKIIIRDTVEVVNHMRIKARGNFRRNLCSSPPIKMNFKKTEFFSDALDNIKSLKLVNVCRKNRLSQEYIFKEYLAYRILNILTDNSLRVRLMKINFEDTSEKQKNSTSYGFIIEDIDELGERMNAFEIERELANQDLTNVDQMNLVSVFQFMIGNTDWSVPALHNVKLLKSNDVTDMRPYAIPYDFDFSGFVDAAYAHPNEQLPITDVKQRLFRGMCRQPEAMTSTFELFKSKKEEIMNLLNEFPHYSEASKNHCTRYIKEFYSILESEKDMKNHLIVNCN